MGNAVNLVSTNLKNPHSQSLSSVGSYGQMEREVGNEFLVLYRAFLSLFYLCSQSPVEEKRLGDEGFFVLLIPDA
jgi:hypothetical protein